MFPKNTGYVFDPLSIIYCYDNNKLISILYEVKNTTNEQHTYIFKGDADSKILNYLTNVQNNFMYLHLLKWRQIINFLIKCLKMK